MATTRFVLPLSAFISAFVLFCAVPAIEGAVTSAKLQGYPDLPSPLAKLKTVAAGSLVIAMDDLQLSGTKFNIRAYGLAVRLLYADVPVYWVIRSGKAKDQADFTSMAHRINSTASSSASVSFAGGPLVIPASYAATVTSLISSAGFGDVVVYVLDEAATVDVRHVLITRPKAILSNLSTYAATLSAVLTDAGLVSGTHFVSASQTESSVVVSSLGESSCYTMFAEPHYVFDVNAPPYLASVQNFVNSGGNFFAQCAAINSYENRGSGFMSQYGVASATSTSNQNLVFPYPDLPFSQLIGSIDGNVAGVTSEFSLVAPSGFLGSYPATEASWWQPNAYPHVYNNQSSSATGTGAKTYISSATKVTDDITGGMVFFMGSHEYTSASRLVANGRRMFLNAYLTPANRPSTCGFEFCPSGETCTAGPCQSCLCVNNQKVITNATCCTNGVPVTCPSVTPTTSPTPSISVTPSPTTTPAPSVTATPSISPSRTPSVTPTPSVTATLSPSLTPTSSVTATPSIPLPPTPSVTPSLTPTPSPSLTPTPSVTATPSISLTPTPSVTPSITPTPSISLTATPSVTATPSISLTPTPSVTPSHTPTSSPSLTPMPSVTATPSISLTPTPSFTPSATPTSSPSLTPTSSITPTPSPSPTPSASPSESPSSSPSATSSSSNSPSATPTQSPSTTPSPSNSPSASPSVSPSVAPSGSASPSRSPASSSSSHNPLPSVLVSPSASSLPAPASSPSGSSSPSASPVLANAESGDGSAAIGLAAGVGGGLALLAAITACAAGLGMVAWRRRRAPGEEEIIRNFAPFFVEVANKGASQTLTTVDAADV